MNPRIATTDLTQRSRPKGNGWRGLFTLWLAAWLLILVHGCGGRISLANRTLPFAPKEVTIEQGVSALRVVVLGDFGMGNKGQFDVARAIAELHRKQPFQFGITVGDNFYQHGVSSIHDPKWKTRWEEPYGGLGFPFYPTLGNHDYYGDVQSQLEYKSPSDSWRMVARQFVLRNGLADWFALDTTDQRTEQYAWLDKVLSASKARWKIVYGHHPIYSAGSHGDTEALEHELLPVIRGRAVLYVAGHDHDLQYLKPVDGTHLVVSGGGGGRLRRLRQDPRVIFGQAIYGFTTLDINESRILVEMFDRYGKRIYEAEITEAPSRPSIERATEALSAPR